MLTSRVELPSRSALSLAIAVEIAAYRRARRDRDASASWIALERAHILSQPLLLKHLHVHALMLGFAVRTGDIREAAGQLARLFLAPLGALTGRLPWGNTGRSNLSAFKAMPIPDDLRSLVAPRSRNAKRPRRPT